MCDKPENCERCGDPFDPRELNDVGLCAPCVEDEEHEAGGRNLARELREMSNNPYEKEN